APLVGWYDLVEPCELARSVVDGDEAGSVQVRADRSFGIQPPRVEPVGGERLAGPVDDQTGLRIKRPRVPGRAATHTVHTARRIWRPALAGRVALANGNQIERP